MLDRWIEPPYQPIYHIGESNTMIVPMEFAFTGRQRAWYLRVFTGECHFPKFTPDGEIGICGRSDNLEVHHITPDSWTRAQEPWKDPDDTVGIVLCRGHHNGTIHPDIQEARDNYRYDQQSFAKAIHQHHVLSERGEHFWNDEWDVILRAIAEEKIAIYMTNNPDDKYPVNVAWGKKPHPKEKKWYSGLFD